MKKLLIEKKHSDSRELWLGGESALGQVLKKVKNSAPDGSAYPAQKLSRSSVHLCYCLFNKTS